MKPSVINYTKQAFTYKHKTSYHGEELRKRKELKARGALDENPAFGVEVRSLYDLTDDQLIFAAGFKDRLLTVFKNLDQEYEFEDLRKEVLPPADYSKLEILEDLEFRVGQMETLIAVDSTDGGIIVAPTGFGKSFIAIVLSIIYPKSNISFIAPGKSLLESLYSRFLKVCPSEVGRIWSGHCEQNKRIKLCSADSIHKLPYEKDQLIIYDEVHTAATEKRSEALCSRYTDAKFIGFTASPNSRADGADAVVESIFGPILLEVPYEEAVKAKSVVPINVRFVDVPRTGLSPVISSGMRMDQKKKAAYWTNVQRNQIIANTVADLPKYVDAEDPQILIMCETVEHILELRHFLPDFEIVFSGISDSLRKKLTNKGLWLDEFEINRDLIDELKEAGEWNSESFKTNLKLVNKLREEGRWESGDYMTPSKKDYLLRQFEQGKLKRVIANHCWKQGIDPVHLNVFIRADGGTSTINNIQLPGRLSRINKNKSEGLLIDFNDNWSEWSEGRSKKRKRDYKKTGFNICDDIKL